MNLSHAGKLPACRSSGSPPSSAWTAPRSPRSRTRHIPRCRTQRALATLLGLPVTELFPQVEPSRSILEGMRDERRLTVAEACAEIDITPRVLMKAEAGQPVALQVRRKISTFYEVPIAYWYRPQKLDSEVAA